MSACSSGCGFCGRCSAAWQREADEREPEVCVCLEPDVCDGVAVMRIDTSNGYIKPEAVCQACADWQRQRDEDGPPDDAEPWSGGFAPNH